MRPSCAGGEESGAGPSFRAPVQVRATFFAPSVYWAFPFTYLAMAWPGHGQVALETKRVARTLGPKGPDLRYFCSPPTPLGHGHGQISKWERPVNFRKRHLGWGGVGTRRPEADMRAGVGWNGSVVKFSELTDSSNKNNSFTSNSLLQPSSPFESSTL